MNRDSMIASIQSERLDLIAMSPAFLRASLARDIHKSEQEIRLALPSGWPGERDEMLSLRLKQLEADQSLGPWLIRAMALRQRGVMVGHIGFHTAPGADYLRSYSPGAVEFGFTVFPAFRRQGYAREASLALMRWARQNHGVTKFVLSIRPDNVASQALAAQLGFVRIGSHLDDLDGLEDVLEYKVSDDESAEPSAAPNGGPAASVDNPNAPGGPPSVS
jgi:[ribosomal protein S5]-alanine N-acetyltransferase